MMSDSVLISGVVVDDKWVVLKRLSNGTVSWLTGDGERFLSLAITAGEEEGQ